MKIMRENKMFRAMLMMFLMLSFPATAYFAEEDSGLYQDEVSVNLYSDYFENRGYEFEDLPTQCDYALITYTREASYHASTVYFTQCHRGLFHYAIINVYRNLSPSKVQQSLEDVRHLFLQAATEDMNIDNFIKKCLRAPDGFEAKHEEKFYTFECFTTDKDYLFKLYFNGDHEHPAVRLEHLPKCFKPEIYEGMLKKRFFKRAKFSQRLDDFYFMFPEEEPEEYRRQREERIKNKYRSH